VPATPSFFGGQQIHVYRDRDGALPGATPRYNMVRSPMVGGGENVQALGKLPGEWILDVELDASQYTTISTTMLGTAQILQINNTGYGAWILEEISRVQRDIERQTVRCTLRLMDNSQ
jgi:hypothetical protein